MRRCLFTNLSQIFLVDNSASMAKEWANAREILEGLSHLLETADPDGMDLYFTNSAEEVHSRRPKDLLRAFDSVQKFGQSNMKNSLARISAAYHPENIKKRSRTARFMRPWQSKKEKHGVNIYVLTDGMWESDSGDLCGVDEPIRVLVKKYVEVGLDTGMVGIQFISFGNDKIGLSRLNRLDQEHVDLGIPK
jgi:hypothetical protein